MRTTIESSWDNARLADQNAKLRNALVGCERAGELLACAGHKEAAKKILDIVSDALNRSCGNPETEQVGWVYTCPDITKKIPPVLSLHQLDNKHCWIERPIYAVEKT